MNLPKWLVKFAANLHISKYPMWFHYKPCMHKLKGIDIQTVLNTVRAGDLLFRRHDGYVNTAFTPGFWGHVGLAISPTEIIHATGNGVLKETVLDFCRTDHICIARLKETTPEYIKSVVDTATTLIGLEYDYAFETSNSNYYCSELVDYCHKNAFAAYYTKQIIGKQTILLPASILQSDLLTIVLDIRKN
jgi:uncharacterized protein YycO